MELPILIILEPLEISTEYLEVQDSPDNSEILIAQTLEANQG